METARRASVSAWNGFVDCNSISFAGFSMQHTLSGKPPQNSLLPDRALFPGGLSGKSYSVVAHRAPPRAEPASAPVDFPPRAPQYDWYVISCPRGFSLEGLTFRDHRLMHWLSKVRAHLNAEFFFFFQ